MTSITGHSQALFCAMCGAASTVKAGDFHHIIHRSAGGGDGPAVYLCRDDHNRLHAEKVGGPTLRAVHIPGEGGTGTFVVVDHEGHTIVERPAFQVMTDAGPLEPEPEGWDAGVFVAQLQNAPHQLQQLSGRFRLLRDDELVAAGEALAGLSSVAWELRARLFRLALSRAPWGRKDALLMDVARQFGLERRQAREEAAILGWLDDHPEVEAIVRNPHDSLPSKEVLKVFMAAEDPAAAAELYDNDMTARQLSDAVKGVVREWCEHNECVCGAHIPHYRKVQ